MFVIILTIIVLLSIAWISVKSKYDLKMMGEKAEKDILDAFEQDKDDKKDDKKETIYKTKERQLEEYLAENLKEIKTEQQAIRRRFNEIKLAFLKIFNTGLFNIEKVLESNELEDEEKTIFYKISNGSKEVSFGRSALRFYIKFKLLPQAHLSDEENKKLTSSNIILEVYNNDIGIRLDRTIQEIDEMYRRQQEEIKAKNFIEKTSILDHLEFPEMKEEFIKAQKLLELEKNFKNLTK